MCGYLFELFMLCPDPLCLSVVVFVPFQMHVGIRKVDKLCNVNPLNNIEGCFSPVLFIVCIFIC